MRFYYNKLVWQLVCHRRKTHSLLIKCYMFYVTLVVSSHSLIYSNFKNLNLFTYRLMEGWPNTYTFSKALCENMIEEEARGMPVCIYRPTIGNNTGPMVY